MKRNEITRRELIDIVYHRLNEDGRWERWSSVNAIVKEVFRCIPDLIEDGNKVKICKCMTLQPYLLPERTTVGLGTTTIVPERYRVRFTPLHDLKRACENLYKNEQEKEVEEGDEM